MVTQAPRVPSSFDRAVSAGNWPVRHPDGHYLIASSSRPWHDHEVAVTADGLTCSCEAGAHGRPDCKHRAALRWCLLHNIVGRYLLCPNCRTVRVTKEAALCPGCRALASVAQQNDVRLAEQEQPQSLRVDPQPAGGFLNLPVDFDGTQRRVPFGAMADAAFEEGWDEPFVPQAAVRMETHTALDEMFA